MKKIITAAFVYVSSLSISGAQITITAADVAVAGKVIYQTTDTLKTTPGSINPGPAGVNQTWNFSNLLSHGVDTLYFTNPAWIPGGSNFPTSNLAVQFPDGSAYFLRNVSNGLYAVGAYGDFTGQGVMSVPISPNETITSFSNTFNSSFSSTSSMDFKMPITGITGVDSVRIKTTTIKNNMLTDGWGSVITPLGTFNAIRQRGKVVTIDSVWAHAMFPPPNGMWTLFQSGRDSSWRFSWWANGVGFPLLEMDSTAGDTIRGISWLKTLPAPGSVYENPAFSGVIIYPNPSTGNFMVSVPSTITTGTAEVYSSLGEKVAVVVITGGKEVPVALEAPAQGVYYLRLSTPEGAAVRKLIIAE